jgi:hypothetical protein
MAAKVTERKNSIINSSGSPSGLLAHSSMRQGRHCAHAHHAKNNPGRLAATWVSSWVS